MTLLFVLTPSQAIASAWVPRLLSALVTTSYMGSKYFAPRRPCFADIYSESALVSPLFLLRVPAGKSGDVSTSGTKRIGPHAALFLL